VTIEYSNGEKFHNWPDRTDNGVPVDWKLDEDDEEQLRADVQGAQALLDFVKRRLENGSESITFEKPKPQSDV
jgi:hypothetical protein